MPTNKNVLIDRDKFLGGSEISTILGISPFKDRFTLLQEKAGIKEIEYITNEYIEFGNEMEKYIRDYINLSYEDKFYEDTIIKKEDIINLRCNYDGLSKTMGLEIKTTSIIKDNVKEYKHYIVQLLYGLMLAGLDKGLLVVYKRNEDFKVEFEETRLHIYEINRKDYKDWEEEIVFAIQEFKEDLEKLKANPFLTEEELLPNELIEVSNKLVMFELKLEEMKEIELQAKEMKAQLKSLMEKHNKDKWITPKGIKISLVKDTPDKEIEEQYVNEDLFIRENPKLHEKYHTKMAEYLETRTITKKGKSGYVRVTIPKA